MVINNTQKYWLHGGDCLEILKGIPASSVDLLLTDLPYGTTQNKWDTVIPFEPLWEKLLRVVKPNGALVFTATQPFTSFLVCSKPNLFKYEMIWEKTVCSGQLNVKRQPLRAHESILVFYREQPSYNEQKTIGEPYSISRKVSFEGPGYGKQKDSKKENDGFRHARSVLKISNPRSKGGHPTQKPVELMEHLIKMYTKEGDIVLDPCMGSGTTGRAALKLGRRFIGIELDKVYFSLAEKNLSVF